MRVAFILSGLGPGGAERVVSLIASGWVEAGHDCTIITFDRLDDPIYHPVCPRVALVRLNLPAEQRDWSRRAGHTLRRTVALRRAIRDSRPDLVISFLTKINALALIASLGLRVPVVVSERNNPRRQAAHPAWNLLLGLLYRRAGAIVMQSRASLDCLPRSVRGKAVVIPNPIMVWPIQNESPEPSTLAAVGRLCDQKGFDLLLPAFAKVAPSNPGWRLDIWGEGPRRGQLESQALDLRIADRVFFPGVTDRPGGWRESATAFVLSSRYEGFPNVLGEAMSSGLPVAAFACEFGPGEMIVDGEDGLLVPPEDVGALAAALDRLMGDSPLRARLGASARRSARQFDPARILPKWTELADRVIRSKTG